MRVLILIVLWACLGGCASNEVRCDGRLTRINVSSPQNGSHAP